MEATVRAVGVASIGPPTPTEPEAGPGVVFLHGQPGTGAWWDPVSRLLDTEFRVLAPDRVGYGASAGEAGGLAVNADLVAALIREEQLGPATVVAHSWAGGAAVLLAARHPATVKSLVLVGAACTPDSLNALDRWLNIPAIGTVLTVAGLVGIGEVLPRIRRLTRFAPPRSRLRLAAALPDEALMGGNRGALARNTRSFMVEQKAIVDELPLVTALLGRLHLPVSVVSGDWDLVVPPRAAVSLARAIPGAELTFFPRAGHFVARDDPRGLAELIRRSVRSRAGVPESPDTR